MGNFRVVVNAIGGHGCQRERKDGEQVFGCRSQTCPDCVTQEFVEKLKKICNVNSADLLHWPETSSEVRDEFVGPVHNVESTGDQHYVNTLPIHRIRHGNF